MISRYYIDVKIYHYEFLTFDDDDDYFDSFITPNLTTELSIMCISHTTDHDRGWLNNGTPSLSRF